MKDSGRLERGAGWWAMLLGLAVVATMSAALWFAYLYLRFVAEQWPPEGVSPPALTVPIISVALLVLSTLPLYLTVTRIGRGDVSRLKIGVAAALLLGAASLGGQLVGYLSAEFGIDSHSYGSLYFVVGGFHSALLVVGLLMLTLLLLWSMLGYFDDGNHHYVKVVSLYWYFLAAAWVPTGALLYLSPHVL